MKLSPQTAVPALLCFVVGFALAWHANTPASAQSAKPPEAQGQTYQISAFGSADNRTRFGAYVLNTKTGKVWLITESQGQPIPIVGTPPNANF